VTGQRIPTAAVLKSRGVPLRVHRLVTDEDTGAPAVPYARLMDGDAEDASPLYEERWLQFTNSVLVDMESDDIGWGSLDAWEDALQKQPTQALVRTLALALEVFVPGQATAAGSPVPDLRRMGKMMLDGETDEYATVVGAAFAISQGISPEHAGAILKQGVKNAREVRPLIDAEVQKLLEKEQAGIDQALRELSDADAAATPTSPTGTPSPGTPGTPAGPEPVAASTSSGS
jgi:hypothetical protein